MSEMKPCPFCGELHGVSASLDMHFGECWSICCARKTIMSVWKQEDVPLMVDRWNTRPIEDAMRARLKEAEENVMAIIYKALAGYDDAYKYADANGVVYTQWGLVEKDIRAYFAKREEK